MSFKQSVIITFVTFGFAAFSAQAQANDLYTTNNTKLDSTCRTNDLMCSTDVLGDAGITRAGKTLVTPFKQLKLACGKYLHDCKADLYMSTNCDKSGASKIATIKFDVLDTGVKSIEVFDPSYSIIGSGFNVTITGGPGLAKK